MEWGELVLGIGWEKIAYPLHGVAFQLLTPAVYLVA